MIRSGDLEDAHAAVLHQEPPPRTIERHVAVLPGQPRQQLAVEVGIRPQQQADT